MRARGKSFSSPVCLCVIVCIYPVAFVRPVQINGEEKKERGREQRKERKEERRKKTVRSSFAKQAIETYCPVCPGSDSLSLRLVRESCVPNCVDRHYVYKALVMSW